MAKKSFSKAPALQFLTRPIEEEEEIVSTASEKEAPSLADFTDKTEDAAKVIIEDTADNSLKETSDKIDSDTQPPAQPVKASENTRQEHRWHMMKKSCRSRICFLKEKRLLPKVKGYSF